MDRITYEIIRNALYTIGREMKIAMMHTAGSPIIHSGGDASAAIFDGNMQLVAQGNDIPAQLGSAVLSTRKSVETIGIENLRPGDVIISNDVYLANGNHQPDVQFTRPVFFDDEIIAYTMTRGHWTDIGGSSPGSYTPATWDLHAEGIRIPPVLIYRDDAPVGDMVRLITQNTRDVNNRLLDIRAQYSGAFVGDRRLQELARKYGKAAIKESMKQSLDYSERLIRSEIANFANGVYYGEDYIEPVSAPGWPADLIPIKVKITKKADEFIFDYTGSSAQVRGGVNCPLAVTYNATWYTVKAITDPLIPINQGCYRPITIICPEGSVLNCRYPASVVSGNTETSPRLIDMLLTALAPAMPGRVVAQSHDGGCAANFYGPDPIAARVHAMRRLFATLIDIHVGGFGARPDKDGINAMRVHSGNAGAQPIELIEHDTPLVIEKWELVTDSGGPGRFRGGCASERVYRVGYDEATLTVIGERGRVAPAGLFGGYAGTLFESSITRADGSTEKLAPKGGLGIIQRGDRVRIAPAGSGGYGDPCSRDPEAVLADVLDGYVSREAARDTYSVVLSADGCTLDVKATQQVRQAAKKRKTKR